MWRTFIFKKSDNSYVKPYKKVKILILLFLKYFSKFTDFFMMFKKKSTSLVFGWSWGPDEILHF